MIKLPAYLTGFSSKSDGSAGIRFSTQELTSDDFALLQQNLNKFGYLVFKENELQEEDTPQEDAEEDRTPSKRLRNTIFVWWTQEGKQGDFETFYRSKMELIIEGVKKKLE